MQDGGAKTSSFYIYPKAARSPENAALPPAYKEH